MKMVIGFANPIGFRMLRVDSLRRDPVAIIQLHQAAAFLPRAQAVIIHHLAVVFIRKAPVDLLLAAAQDLVRGALVNNFKDEYTARQ